MTRSVIYGVLTQAFNFEIFLLPNENLEHLRRCKIKSFCFNAFISQIIPKHNNDNTFQNANPLGTSSLATSPSVWFAFNWITIHQTQLCCGENRDMVQEAIAQILTTAWKCQQNEPWLFALQNEDRRLASGWAKGVWIGRARGPSIRPMGPVALTLAHRWDQPPQRSSGLQHQILIWTHGFFQLGGRGKTDLQIIVLQNLTTLASTLSLPPLESPQSLSHSDSKRLYIEKNGREYSVAF